jgi:hypothetical protein
MPPLLSPQKESIVAPWNVTFDWDAGPPEHYLNYTLYYGTDKNMVINAGATPGNPINIPKITWPAPTDGLLIVIALMLMLTLFSATDQRDRRAVGLRRAAITGFFVFSLVACSDGGGSGWSGEAVPLSSSTALTSVNTGNITSYQTDNLLAGTTYYWKVDALSTTDPGTVFHSETYSFTTE